MNDNFKLTLRPLLSKNGRLTELCEEIVVYRAPFVKVEIHEPQPGLVDGLLKGVRSAAYRRPSQRSCRTRPKFPVILMMVLNEGKNVCLVEVTFLM